VNPEFMLQAELVVDLDYASRHKREKVVNVGFERDDLMTLGSNDRVVQRRRAAPAPRPR